MSGSHLSKDFFDLVKSIGESRSKQEEDKIISTEVRVLKAKMMEKNVSPKKMKEYLIRMIYVEMLGHGAEFGHIHGVKMVSESNLLHKRVGYLAVCLSLHCDHELMLLMINTIQSDLGSDNFLQVSMALTVVCKLISVETLPTVKDLVVKLLGHHQANIRKKAVMALHRFHQIDPSVVTPLNDAIRKILCDKDPSVMGASLSLFIDLCSRQPTLYKDLVPSFVSILKQVTEHRLPRDYDYHRMPAPWIQLKLLRVLACLGAADKRASEGMYEILHEVMKRADIGINVGYAIVYEAVRTVTTIYPDSELIEDAATSISRFITSDNHNLKYLGINSLAAIVQINPKYAAEHQLVVIDCLEDKDETLKRKTLDLLFSMTNPRNVVVIVQKLIDFLEATNDVYLKTELVDRINQLAEKYSPSTSWYIDTLNRIFELGGKLVKPEVAHSAMNLIAEGGDEDDDDDIRGYAVDAYVDLLQGKRVLPDISIQVMAWTLGEYGHLADDITTQELIVALCKVMERQFDDPGVRSWIFGALSKLVAHFDGQVPAEVLGVAERYQKSLNVDLQQRTHEFNELVKNRATMKAALPLDASGEELLVDEDLSFLSAYVESAAVAGAKRYEDRSSITGKVIEEADAGLIFAYKDQPKATEMNFPAENAGHGRGSGSLGGRGSQQLTASGVVKTNTMSTVWGPVVEEPEVKVESSSTDPYGAPAPAVHKQVKSHPKPVKKEPAVREKTAREKAAEALFGDSSLNAPTRGKKTSRRNRGKTSNKGTGSRKGTKAVHPAAEQPTPAPSSAGVDFLGLDAETSSPAAPAAAPTPAPAPTATSGLADLFDVFDTPAAPSAAPATNVPSATGSGLDFFSELAISPSAPATGGALDVFGDLGQPAGSQCPVGAAGMSQSMQAKLAGLPQDPKDTPLASNEQIHISFKRVRGPDRAIMVLFVTNKSQAAIQNVSIQLRVPAGLNVGADGEPAPSVQPVQGGTTLNFQGIAAGTTITQLVSLQCTNVNWLSAPSIQGSLSYMGSQLNFQLPLSIKDMLRPAALSTQQYGVCWGKYTCEVKASLPGSSLKTSVDFMRRMQSQIGIHPVQTIGLENICAGVLVNPQGGNDPNMFVFMHARVSPAGLDVTVRSKVSPLSAAIQKYSAAVLR